ncbi:MAG TPA: SBBP repeat-containing protein [Thermoanaerobaculia bacterium]|nr:SBBP repeat-containing protein [Thermoanaerobaculia bacterium]
MEGGVFMRSFCGSGRIKPAVALAASFFGLAAAASAVPKPAVGPAATLSELAAKLPLRFEENAGQVKKEGVRYFARGRGYRLFLSPGEAVFSLGDGKQVEKTVRLRLAGGAEQPLLAGIDPLPTKSNYLLGNDPRAWHTGVASFGGVRYEQVYPGTDLVFSGNDRRVEQSFFLAAGAEPRRIRLLYEGATAASLGKEGELIVRTPGGELTADRPVAYQVIDGERRPVECRYELLAQKAGAPAVGFVLGAYDRKLPLVIDPVFENSTFLGGADSDNGSSVAVDGAGNVYVAGVTSSTDFPGTVSPGGVQPANGGSADGFVAKIDPTGTTLLYATYLGGDDLDSILGIAVDPAGNAYLTGFTFSSNFPGVTAGSLQSSYAGGPGDAFVAKLSPAGSSLLYATYLGGTGNDVGYAIAADASGNAYVSGHTASTDFPGVLAGSLQPGNAGGSLDGFVAKVNAAGSAIVYATYLGGSDQDIATAIAVDAAGDAVVAGTTCSANFPVTAGSLAPVSPGVNCGAGLQDSFVAKLNPLGTAFVYSTFLGGEGNDAAQGLAVDTAGNAYVTGFTSSASFTGVTAGSFQPANPGGTAAFVTKVNSAGSAAVYSTFLGGNGTFGNAITLDAAANAYVTGRTDDPDFPIVNAATLQPAAAGFFDGFVTKIAATGASLGFSTYFGGTDYDSGSAIAVDGTSGAVYVTGQSFSTHLPGVTAGSIQPASGAPGVDDAFLVRIVPAAILSITKTADTSLVDPGGKITYTLTYQNVGELNATGATLTETVPADTVFRPTQSSPGWTCTPDANAGSACTLALGTVAVGASGSATFTVRVKNNVSASGSQISNTACAHPGPNCATVQTPTTAAPILSITKTANFTEAKPGNVLRYTIKAFNTGNQDASPVTITDTVPPNSVFDPANSTAGWSCSPDNSAGSVCTFPVGTLATGNHATVTFAADLSTLYSNTACVQVAAPQPELRSPKARRSAKALPAPACSTATTPLK